MTDHPIIFSGPMVRALLDGRKTMTRRLAFDKKGRPTTWSKILLAMQQQRELEERIKAIRPGDRLWVREAFAFASIAPIVSTIDNPMAVWREGDGRTDYGGPWKPSIHMPRRASRLTLVVTATKLERLQDISEADAIAEGVVKNEPSGDGLLCTYVPGLPEAELLCADGVSAGLVFGRLWRHLHGPESWDANPEVVAISFTVHKTNIDQMKEAA